MFLKVYHYSNCGTCRKALKWLDARGILYTDIDITEKPPTKAELKKMLEHYDGDLRLLFNTSGLAYREQKIKDRLPALNPSEAIDLLAGNGRLVKHPFVLTPKAGLVGFKEDEWKSAFG